MGLRGALVCTLCEDAVKSQAPFEEERDERTSARCTSGAVRELALLDGTTRRDRVRLRVLDQAPRGCWGVLLLDVEERGRDRRAAGRRQATR